MRVLVMVGSVLLVVSSCAGPRETTTPGGKRVVGETSCAAPLADQKVSTTQLDAEIAFLKETLTNSKLSVEQQATMIRSKLPDVDRFERIEYRLCLARERNDISPEDYKRMLESILPRVKEALVDFELFRLIERRYAGHEPFLLFQVSRVDTFFAGFALSDSLRLQRNTVREAMRLADSLRERWASVEE